MICLLAAVFYASCLFGPLFSSSQSPESDTSSVSADETPTDDRKDADNAKELVQRCSKLPTILTKNICFSSSLCVSGKIETVSITATENTATAIDETYHRIFQTAQDLVNDAYETNKIFHYFVTEIPDETAPDLGLTGVPDVIKHTAYNTITDTCASQFDFLYAYIPLFVTQCYYQYFADTKSSQEISTESILSHVIFLCVHAVLAAIDAKQKELSLTEAYEKTPSTPPEQIIIESNWYSSKGSESYCKSVGIEKEFLLPANQELIIGIAGFIVGNAGTVERVTHCRFQSHKNPAEQKLISYSIYPLAKGDRLDTLFLLQAYAPLLITMCYEEFLRRKPGHGCAATMSICACAVLNAINRFPLTTDFE